VFVTENQPISHTELPFFVVSLNVFACQGRSLVKLLCIRTIVLCICQFIGI